MTGQSSLGDGSTEPGLNAIMSERRRLINLTYRMLGSLAESEDAVPEPVKRFETRSYEASFAISSTGMGSLIHATVGSRGGCGRRWRNRAGFAA